MTARRFVVLGLSSSRAEWFSDVARWATVGSIPVEFVKCISPEELRVRLTSDRAFSAVVVDASSGVVDRDLIGSAEARATAVLVVDAPDRAEAWRDLGADAVLPPRFDRTTLLTTLDAHARSVATAEREPGEDVARPEQTSQGHLIAVTGPGGTGASTVAIALAQGLASLGPTLLADLRLRGEQAMLHDARDLVPGLPELVEAHRRGHPRIEDVESLTFTVPRRGYRLLLGLRRAHDWSELRPRAVEAALRSLTATFSHTVADVDPDTEGESQGGSIDVEERHVLARTALGRADLVLCVGQPGLKGIHALARVIAELQGHGVGGARVLALVNRAPRAPRGRAEINRAVAALTTATGDPVLGLVHLPGRRGIDEVHRDGSRLPAALVQPVTRAVVAALDALGPAVAAERAPVLVSSGSLGRWAPAAVSR